MNFKQGLNMINTIKKQNIEKSPKNYFELISFFLFITVFFVGCSGGSVSPSSTVASATDSFYIKSAVYDNNATPSVLDDKLYIYFNQSINPASISINMSINYILDGAGIIGTASTSVYDDSRFHQHIISLNNYGADSTALVANDTNISIAPRILQDTHGNYTIYDENKSTVKKFRVVLKTGENISYTDNNATDGYYQSAKARSYTDNAQTITDNATGLIWQKDGSVKNWADALTYCTNITLDGNSNFRLPTIEELVQLSDKGRSNPAIDPIFTNTNNSFYWSSTTYEAETTSVWGVVFNYGYDATSNKTVTAYVRCVR